MKEDSQECTYTIPCEDTVQCVEFSPFEWSYQLLAVGTSSGVSVYSCRFQEEDAEVANGIEFKRLRDFPSKSATPLAIAWSPQTSLQVLPKLMSFAVAADDRTLQIFATDMNSTHSVKVLSGHSDYVNALTFDPNEGVLLASTGDDMTCRVWSVSDGTQESIFQLTSPGMSVCWHADEPFKLMVAQKDGTIRFLSLHNQQPIMSLSCGQSPLMSADWSRHNNLLVGAVCGSEWLVFNVSVSSLPIERRPAHNEGGKHFRWSRCHESLLATCGRPGRQLKVFNTRHQQLHVSTSLPISYGLSWHLHLPLVAVGGDRAVHLWTVESI
ncbi:nucleoporin Nup37 [Aplysia californica]|uniref:Nucleoporin Nup37 n=1 Tax=Aplysia californica TaxID=6500 RepID=A0ABM0K5H3_APLCA|nr:nucleoporin Nup37 [Aplysia californica]